MENCVEKEKCFSWQVRRLFWKGMTEESRHFRISLLGQPGRLDTHPCSLLLGHLACPGGMGVNIGNSEQEGENQELETEF